MFFKANNGGPPGSTISPIARTFVVRESLRGGHVVGSCGTEESLVSCQFYSRGAFRPHDVTIMVWL
jgi:hypothetical protein